MILENGAGAASECTDHDARKIDVVVGERDNQSFKPTSRSAQVYTLRRGRSRLALARVIPYDSLYRVEWPDGTFSEPANLTRCKSAAREWAERQAVTENRKSAVARRLKSLNNFWWSSSPITQNVGAAP